VPYRAVGTPRLHFVRPVALQEARNGAEAVPYQHD